MKKLSVLSFVLFFFSLLSGETLYYYAGGKKIELAEDFSSYSFIRTSITRAGFVMPEGVKTLKKHKNISIVEVQDKTGVRTLKNNGSLFPAYIKEGTKVYVSGMMFIKIPGQPDGKNAEKWCTERGMTLIRHYKYIPEWYLVSVEGNPIKKAAELVEKKIAAEAEPSFFIRLKKRTYTPNDPLFKNQWHLNNDSSNTAVSGNDHAHVAEAWEVIKNLKGNLGGEGVKLAIVDDGFDLNHEDFAGKFLDGYDFGDNDDIPMYENNNWNPEYSDMHGTCCAGVAAATTDNGKGVSGACPECKIIPIRMDMYGYSLDEPAIEAFEWAADAGADIISNSWGPADNEGAVDMNTPLKNLVKELTTTGRDCKGIIILFAAGNGDEDIDGRRSKDGFAGNENVFAIGATNASGERASYSDYGKSLDFMAPSCDIDYYSDEYWVDGIWTVDNTGKDGYNTGNSSQGDSRGNYTNDFGGTSSACPLAAGITGLLLSVNPKLTKDHIYEILKETSDKVGNGNYSNGFSEYYGYGRINAYKAVNKAIEMENEIDDTTCDIADSGDSTDTADSGDSTDTADSSDTADSGDTDTDENQNCGNDVVDEGEECDDGNRMNGDGCSKNCKIEENSGTEDNNLEYTDRKRSGSDGCSAIVL